MKPDWKDAPEWANWIAMDSNGAWWWYENMPASGEREWYADRGGRTLGVRGPAWTSSLTQRPETSEQSEEPHNAIP